MWTVSGLVGAAVGIAVLVGAALLLGFTRWSWVPAPVVDRAWWAPVCYGVYGVARAVIAPRWRYRVHRWEVTADVVYTRVGWLSRAWQLVPVSRIQTVDHTQGWLERMFGLATLEVRTASHAGSSKIEGLRAEVARELSEQLAVRAGELRDDAT
ncbi:hypothetical protein DEF23_08420 [Marinitenerispora sediminis]|uniref:YdbS-like PH domain-containing protein n=2 Tax=Marinitenerispora sediminis TaxID=1931232 RepID=A0A368SYV3_9ACTN|nr:hypothetical protein DEF28_22200 [Marinitenerispora sediminis]RCV49691.1 hypothetical protein DEF24_24945 [Marinitenerispora sediminis]RCV58651.1 hypothetical protein DEF23_08420 [Marinitenerispora sediminis]